MEEVGREYREKEDSSKNRKTNEQADENENVCPCLIRLSLREAEGLKEGVMKTKIGEMAGRVWKVLGERDSVAVSTLPQILKEKGEIVYQAVGWLAREDKIDFRKKEGKTFVSLNSEEREVFKKSL